MVGVISVIGLSLRCLRITKELFKQKPGFKSMSMFSL